MDNLAYKLGSRAVSNRYRTNQNDKVRVCFYGRVSTQHCQSVCKCYYKEAECQRVTRKQSCIYRGDFRRGGYKGI